MTWLISLKAKIYVLGALLVTFLGIILRNSYLAAQNERLRHKADLALAQVRYSKEVAYADTEIDQTFSHRAEVANEQVEDGVVPDNLREPNEW